MSTGALVRTVAPHLIDHSGLVQHVWIEEAIPESDVTVNLSPVWRHPSQHWSN